MGPIQGDGLWEGGKGQEGQGGCTGGVEEAGQPMAPHGGGEEEAATHRPQRRPQRARPPLLLQPPERDRPLRASPGRHPSPKPPGLGERDQVQRQPPSIGSSPTHPKESEQEQRDANSSPTFRIRSQRHATLIPPQPQGQAGRQDSATGPTPTRGRSQGQEHQRRKGEGDLEVSGPLSPRSPSASTR